MASRRRQFRVALYLLSGLLPVAGTLALVFLHPFVGVAAFLLAIVIASCAHSFLGGASQTEDAR